MSNLSWFALNVRAKSERAVAKQLEQKNYSAFAPTCPVRRVRSDRVITLEVPLFPGYVFCQFDPAVRTAPVVTTPGVLSILGFGSKPTAVDDDEVAAIQLIVNSRVRTDPCPYLAMGARVRLHAGPLRGVEGFVLGVKSELRVVVSVTLLQRSIAVDIDPAWATLDD
jgi:transcription antitermination factor NusG